MKSKNLIVNPKYIISQIGKYNMAVIYCINCDKEIDPIKEGIGFNLHPTRPSHKENPIALVYECPYCFTKQWCHCEINTYKLFLQKKGQSDR